MRIAIILNGISLHKKNFYKKYFPLLQDIAIVGVFETQSNVDAFGLAQHAIHNNVDAILAAGGDGTIHHVVNALMDEELRVEELPMFGVIPLGSGNDFARSLGDSVKPEALVKLLAERKTKGIDVGRISFLGNAKKPNVYFINEADIGMGPDVVRKVMSSRKPFGSAVAYYVSILSTFISYKPFQVTVRTDQWQWSGKIRTLAIANGKYFGNGLGIAPDAETDDGKFSTFIVEDVSVLDFIWFSNALKRCKEVNHKKVHYNETKSIELRSELNTVIEADGEVVGNLPVRIDLLPKRIRLLSDL